MKFEEWLAQQNGVIEVDCGCVTAEAFYHWMRVAYEAGNFSAVPDCERPIVPCKWIPVSDRVPEAEGHFLVWANASRIDGYCDHLAIAAYQGREWSNEFNWLVTHWMPLPVGPKGDK